MTVYMPTADATQLAELRADLDQLTRPITVPVRQRSRRSGTRWTAITHPPLLDQLRQAANGQNCTVRGPERRQTPRSRPPGNLEALDRLSAIYVALSGWHTGLSLPSPPRDTDWQVAALRQLHQEARRLDPRTIEAISGDVHDWWRWAAAATGWTTTELVTLRRQG